MYIQGLLQHLFQNTLFSHDLEQYSKHKKETFMWSATLLLVAKNIKTFMHVGTGLWFFYLTLRLG